MDLFTKILPGLKRYQLVTAILYLNNFVGRRFVQVGLDGPTGHGWLDGEYMGQVLYLYSSRSVDVVSLSLDCLDW